ncbi:MAG TPA: integrase core domain-containing protein [Terriglobales bacterium]
MRRLWRSLKYQLVYPRDFVSAADLFQALQRYFYFYNHQRPHQALGYGTPADLFPRQSKRKKSSPEWRGPVPMPPGFIAVFFRVDGFSLAPLGAIPADSLSP